jgi:hypothetical protein
MSSPLPLRSQIEQANAELFGGHPERGSSPDARRLAHHLATAVVETPLGCRKNGRLWAVDLILADLLLTSLTRDLRSLQRRHLESGYCSDYPEGLQNPDQHDAPAIGM